MDPVIATVGLALLTAAKVTYDVVRSIRARAQDEPERVVEIQFDGKIIELPGSSSEAQIVEALREAIGDGSRRPAE